MTGGISAICDLKLLDHGCVTVGGLAGGEVRYPEGKFLDSFDIRSAPCSDSGDARQTAPNIEERVSYLEVDTNS